MEQNQDQEYIEREHCLILEHRRSLKITGVTDVIAYDEHIIQINTTDKALEIRGEGLHMKQLALDKGIIEVEGCVNSLEYQAQTGQSQGASFWKRLLGNRRCCRRACVFYAVISAGIFDAAWLRADYFFSPCISAAKASFGRAGCIVLDVWQFFDVWSFISGE